MNTTVIEDKKILFKNLSRTLGSRTPRAPSLSCTTGETIFRSPGLVSKRDILHVIRGFAASKIIRTLAKTSLLRDYLTHQQQRLLKGFVYVKYSFERALQFLYQKLIDQRDDCEDVSGCTYDRADSVRIILLTTRGVDDQSDECSQHYRLYLKTVNHIFLASSYQAPAMGCLQSRLHQGERLEVSQGKYLLRTTSGHSNIVHLEPDLLTSGNLRHAS